MERRHLHVLLVTAIVFALGLQNSVTARISRRCQTYIRTRHTAQNEFQQTKTTTITPRCSNNEFIWYSPRYDHAISFENRRRPFSLCLRRSVPGMSIYQLRGTSRRMLVSNTTVGELGCFESECNHLTLLFEVDPSMQHGRVLYSYTKTTINKCPKCSEICQRRCLCSAQYMFVGKLQKSKVSNGLYTNYFKISEFIRYDNRYNDHNHWIDLDQEITTTPQCSNDNNTIATYNPMDLTNAGFRAVKIPQIGVVKVYSKCPLTVGEQHLVSADYSKVSISGVSKDRLVMCCGDTDRVHATHQLKEMLLRQQCCPKLFNY